jgi:hypothetical protein
MGSDLLDCVSMPTPVTDDEMGEWFDGLSDERKELLRIRVERALVDTYTEEARLDAAQEAIGRMYVQDLLDGLTERGLIRADHIDEDGEAHYALCGE